MNDDDDDDNDDLPSDLIMLMNLLRIYNDDAW